MQKISLFSTLNLLISFWTRMTRQFLGTLEFNVFLGVSLTNAEMSRILGIPNYMASEQWEPEIRGPISFETDSWGFGCSTVEMLTGILHWTGKSVDDMYKLVVKKQEKSHIRTGLPPAVENVIIGCFDYDFRSRPIMADILLAFKSSQNAVYHDQRTKRD